MHSVRITRYVAKAGGLLLIVGLAIAYGQRNASSPVAAIVVLALGNVLTLGAAGLVAVWCERGRGLTAAVGRRPLPQTTLATATAFVGVVDLPAAPLVSGVFGVLGVLLIAVSLVAAARLLGRGDDGPDLATARAARALAAFAADHGGSGVRAAVEHVGDWYRLVAVAPDGAWGDFVVRGEAQALAAAELAGVDVVDPTDSAALGRLRSGSYEWRRMAGSQLAR